MSTPTNQQRLDACKAPPQAHVLYQSWKELLFLHWRIDPAVIQATLPPGLTVDTFEGDAYLGIVPFCMCNIRPRFLPVVPGISNFLEMNVRTYVHDEEGRPGVWFYSLDANQKLAVRVARKFFNLPYFDAKMLLDTTIKNLVIFGGAWELKMGVVDFRTPPQRIELGTFFWLSSTLMTNI